MRRNEGRVSDPFPAAADKQIALTNATVNFLVGSRYPSWMNTHSPTPQSRAKASRNTATQDPAQDSVQVQSRCVCPLGRLTGVCVEGGYGLPECFKTSVARQLLTRPQRPSPSHTEHSSKAPQQTQAVLPSPAPSDEPSPVLSNTAESPQQASAALSDGQMVATSEHQSAPTHPVTDAHFVPDVNADDDIGNAQDGQPLSLSTEAQHAVASPVDLTLSPSRTPVTGSPAAEPSAVTTASSPRPAKRQRTLYA